MTETLQDTTHFSSVEPSFSMVDLLGQAGGFQWPILAVLIAGIAVLMLCLVRLTQDYLSARPLMGLHLESMTYDDLMKIQHGLSESLYTRLLFGMLQLHRNPEAMGREVSDIASSAHATYQRTQRIVNYCSSTAGGLGLLGTLVGIYALFSTGTRDAQMIFAGIAIAVVSTLLGIVTSILLEFFEAILHGYMSRYIESAQTWAQRVRSQALSWSEQSR
ncbi:MAG: MotA/TolQ/ExbB proton channel family protein [Bacteroidetes bacterium]|nr:MotA/TolQ/ExbB proton channel family protein [Bacteroidota bacterium]